MKIHTLINSESESADLQHLSCFTVKSLLTPLQPALMWWIWEVGWLREREKKRERARQGGRGRERLLHSLPTLLLLCQLQHACLPICWFVNLCLNAHHTLISHLAAHREDTGMLGSFSLSLSRFFKLAENKSWTPLQDQTWRSTVLWIKTVIWF